MDDRALRPISFDTYFGQESAKQNLRIFVESAKARNEPLDHILFTGPPGTGKTTLAQVVAHEMGTNLVVLNSASVKTRGEIYQALLGLEKGDILFLDEIHSLNAKLEEILYPPMEDFRLPVSTGDGSLPLAVALFTLIGATTHIGRLSQPLRDRFGEVVQMQYYTTDELTVIAFKNFNKLGLSCDIDAAQVLAHRSRGTPRIVNRLVRRTRDFAFSNRTDRITVELVRQTCDRLGIDPLGVDSLGRRYLSVLAEKTRPIGLAILAHSLGESKDTIEETVEPHLLRLGFVERLPAGRVITKSGRAHVELDPADLEEI